MAGMELTTLLVRALELRETGQKGADIAESLGLTAAQLGNVLRWLTKGGYAHRDVVEWARLWEMIESGKLACGDDVRALVASKVAVPEGHADAQPTREQFRVLCVLADRELARGRSLRSGVSRMTSGRMDGGLVESLQRYAEGEGIPLTEGLNRAVECFLNTGAAESA